MNSRKKILVTGVAGFIGYHVAYQLMKNNTDVIGVDNLNEYYDVELKKKRISLLKEFSSKKKSPKFIFFHEDISDSKVWNDLICIEFDEIIHLAAQAGVRYSFENPYDYIKSNIVGFQNVIDFARLNNKNLIYASSSSVYGVNSIQPFKEDMPCTEPISLYAISKRTNEMMAASYFYNYNLTTIGLRFFTVYGPYGRPDMAPMLFASAGLNNKEILVYNEGNQKRDFTYIDDISNGICDVVSNFEKFGSGAHIFNLGNGEPINLMDFIKEIENCLGRVIQKSFVKAQRGDVFETFSSIDKINEKMIFHPKTSIKEGVEMFVNWYKGYYGHI